MSIRLQIIDFVKNLKVNEYYKFFTSTSNWNRRQIEEYQIKQLKNLLIYAGENVPFYKKRFTLCGFNPKSFTCINYFKKIKPLTRSDLQQNEEELVANDFDPQKCIKSSSSGTTGTPVSYYHDIDAESAGIASGYALYYMVGWKPGRRGIHIWGNPESIKKWSRLTSKAKRKLLNQRFIPAPLLNEYSNFPAIIKQLIRFKPEFIDGYSCAIYYLASYLLEKKIEIPRPKMIFSTAENLLDYQEEIIEEAIGPVSDLYGCGEINGIAMRPAGSDKYYLMEPHVLVETEKRDDGFMDILVTDLNNMTMPLIRYKLGDLIEELHEGNDNNPFSFKFFKKVVGRSIDIINLGNGRKILPVSLVGGTFMRKFEAIKRHKVVWNGSFLNFIFETNSDVDLNTLRSMIKKTLQPYDVEFKIKLVDKIMPSRNGKFKYFEIVR